MKIIIIIVIIIIYKNNYVEIKSQQDNKFSESCIYRLLAYIAVYYDLASSKKIGCISWTKISCLQS